MLGQPPSLPFCSPCYLGFVGNPTALHLACKGGHLEVVKLLLHAGANTCANFGTEEGGTQETPLHFAVQGSHVEIVREIFKISKASAKITNGWDVPPLKMAKKDEIRQMITDALK